LALLHLLYRRPVITAQEVARTLDISPPTAQTLVREFKDRGILVELTGFARNRVYSFENYLRLFLN
jgi:DNA-binding IclR family transcriptional regulator